MNIYTNKGRKFELVREYVEPFTGVNCVTLHGIDGAPSYYRLCRGAFLQNFRKASK